MSDGGKLRLYADPSHYVPERRLQLSPLLKPLWNERDDDERLRVYGIRARLLAEAPSLEQADVAVLTMTWNHYLATGRTDQAREFGRRAEAAGKRLVVFVSGDFDAAVPIPNAVKLGPSLRRSNRGPHDHALPPLPPDLAELYGDRRTVARPWKPRPTVGFCGQAGGRAPGLALWWLRNLGLHVRARLLRSPFDPPFLTPSAVLRRRVLERLAADPRIENLFVLRRSYWAGLKSRHERTDPRHPARLEFIDNLNASDYVVCVRGTGNFSQRFFETLCWGRVPVFVDTDCVLPYDKEIDWHRHCVWVDADDIPRVAAKVHDFHHRLGPEGFEDLQRACRQLWLDRLSTDGFYRHLHELIL